MTRTVPLLAALARVELKYQVQPRLGKEVSMNLDLEAIALDLLLGSDDGTISASSGGIRLDFQTSTALHPLRRAVQRLVLHEEALQVAKRHMRLMALRRTSLPGTTPIR